MDNSGADIILGVLPFARELLIRGTKVLLCANTEPSLNDITCVELKEVIKKCSEECEVIREATHSEQLVVYGNGQSGPCLDLRRISPGIINSALSNPTQFL